MRKPFALFFLLLAGCVSQPQQPTDTRVIQVMREQGQTAAAAVVAARTINLQTEDTQHRAVVDMELAVAEANLPTPTERQLREALERSNAALQLELTEMRLHYAAAMRNAALLDEELVKAREESARLQQRLASQEAAILKMVDKGWYLIFLLMGGVVFFLLTKNFRMASIMAGLAALVAAGLVVIIRIPEWFITVLSIIILTMLIITPVAAWWTYKAGLFQKPPKKIGSYKIQNEKES